jgi:hypothetical protein
MNIQIRCSNEKGIRILEGSKLSASFLNFSKINKDACFCNKGFNENTSGEQLVIKYDPSDGIFQ